VVRKRINKLGTLTGVAVVKNGVPYVRPTAETSMFVERTTIASVAFLEKVKVKAKAKVAVEEVPPTPTPPLRQTGRFSRRLSAY
jgi:hypothetical protein